MEQRIKRIHICDPSKFVSLGRAGENEFRTVEIDVSDWVSEDAEYKIIYSRPDGITYPVATARNGNILSWELKAYDIEVAGFGEFEVRAYIGDIIGKSATFKIKVTKSIQTDGTEPGTIRPDWIDDIIDKVVIDSIGQTVTSEDDGGTNIFTVTLTDGSRSDFLVRNGKTGNTGERGEKGNPGEDGYTPQRGIDYWTEEDKAEIAGMVNPHIADCNNPHNVTAEQIGALTAESLNDEMGEYIPQLENDIAALFERIGDIDTAFDELHSYALTLIGEVAQ